MEIYIISLYRFTILMAQGLNTCHQSQLFFHINIGITMVFFGKLTY